MAESSAAAGEVLDGLTGHGHALKWFLVAFAGLVALYFVWHRLLVRLPGLRAPAFSPLELQEIRQRHKLEAERKKVGKLHAQVGEARRCKGLYEENKSLLGKARENIGRLWTQERHFAVSAFQPGQRGQRWQLARQPPPAMPAQVHAQYV